jgi:tetratricopeptide (TPR) repeat protein
VTNHKEEALRELRIAVELDPDSALAHHLLGTALYEAQDLNAATREFQEALRLDPSAENHFYLAACLMGRGQEKEALAELEKASSMQPGDKLYRARKEDLLRLMQSSNTR